MPTPHIDRRAALAGLAALPLATSASATVKLRYRKRAHIYVSLADNTNQGIAPTTPTLGDGQSPRTNLYWGALYGMKTYFKRKQGWSVKTIAPSREHVLDAISLSHSFHPEAEIIAEAYDGQFQSSPLNNFFGGLSSDQDPPDLSCFVGHNPLMDIIERPVFATADLRERNRHRSVKASVIACQSARYFKQKLDDLGVEPYVLTRSNMAPEAYVVEGMLIAWLSGKDREAATRLASENYAKYQKISKRSARRVFL